MFIGAQFSDEALPDGTNPKMLISKWRMWVVKCIRLLDSDGAYLHYPQPGGLDEQPSFDMEVYDIIRAKWNELRNEAMKNG